MRPRVSGTQAERTRLAWRRTTLAATVVALLVLGRQLTGGAGTLAQVAAALATLCWLAVLAVAHRRIRELAAVRPIPAVARTQPAALALLIAALALVAALLIG
jgi:hypothetical protein